MTCQAELRSCLFTRLKYLPPHGKADEVVRVTVRQPGALSRLGLPAKRSRWLACELHFVELAGQHFQYFITNNSARSRTALALSLLEAQRSQGMYAIKTSSSAFTNLQLMLLQSKFVLRVTCCLCCSGHQRRLPSTASRNGASPLPPDSQTAEGTISQQVCRRPACSQVHCTVAHLCHGMLCCSSYLYGRGLRELSIAEAQRSRYTSQGWAVSWTVPLIP